LIVFFRKTVAIFEHFYFKDRSEELFTKNKKITKINCLFDVKVYLLLIVNIKYEKVHFNKKNLENVDFYRHRSNPKLQQPLRQFIIINVFRTYFYYLNLTSYYTISSRPMIKTCVVEKTAVFKLKNDSFYEKNRFFVLAFALRYTFLELCARYEFDFFARIKLNSLRMNPRSFFGIS